MLMAVLRGEIKVFRLESSPDAREARTNVVCLLPIVPLLLKRFYVPFCSTKGGNLIYSWHCWSYFRDQGLLWFGQASFLFIIFGYSGSIKHLSCLFDEIILVVPDTLPTLPAALFHFTKLLFYFLCILSFYLADFTTCKGFPVPSLEKCLSLCRLRHQSKLRWPQRWLLMDDLCRKKKIIN